MIDLLRAEKRFANVIEKEDLATLNEVEIRDEITNAIHFLTEEETNLLLEIKLLGRSFKEMAKQMGKTENALKVMLHRTLKSIRERL